MVVLATAKGRSAAARQIEGFNLGPLRPEEGAGFARIIERLVAESGKADTAVDRAVPSDTKGWNGALLGPRGPTSAPVQ